MSQSKVKAERRKKKAAKPKNGAPAPVADPDPTEAVKMLTKKVQEDATKRRKEFIEYINAGAKKFRCRVVAVPGYKPTKDGWTPFPTVEVYADP